MNSKQAKAEPLHEFLARLGHHPARVQGNNLWYKSPFRPQERTESFKIDRVLNAWYDHGLGAGGTIIDFVGQLNNTATDVSRTLAAIADVLGHTPRPTLALPPAGKKPGKPPIIESVGAIHDRMLEQYLTSRAIPVDLARLHLKEVAYRVGGTSYKALGFPNDAGGYEVRSPSFKGTLGKKDISYLAQSGSTLVAVFEGFFDFLSVLAHYGREQAKSSVLVLNSLALLERGATRLQDEGVTRLHAYLDHDEAGRAGLATLGERGAWQITDASQLYAGAKDANEFLARTRREASCQPPLFGADLDIDMDMGG